MPHVSDSFAHIEHPKSRSRQCIASLLCALLRQNADSCLALQDVLPYRSGITLSLGFIHCKEITCWECRGAQCCMSFPSSSVCTAFGHLTAMCFWLTEASSESVVTLASLAIGTPG